MKYIPLLRLATAFVAFSISAHSAEVFYVKTLTTTYPATTAANFNAVAEDGVTLTNPYNIYGTTDIGNGTGVHTNQNFNGLSSAINPGDQVTQGSNTTTYFGPKFYVGINREHAWKVKAGAFHSNGNGYRINASSVSADDIGTAQVGVEGDPGYAAATGNGGEPINTRALFMFDADTSSLTAAADDSLIFNDTDTLTAKLSVPGTFNARASRGTFRAMIKADGQYYAGTLWEVPADHPDSSTLYTITETGADTNWILMPNLETGSSDIGGETNLIVDTSVSATTVSGKYLTNITQVGFLLETDTVAHTGGYNYGVREFTANASSVYAPHPSGIEWSQDFTSDVNGDGTFLTYDSAKLYDGAVDPANLLTGFDHALKWASNGDGLSATPVPSTITQENNQIVLDLKSSSTGGEVNIRMVGPGTNNARRVRPASHEVTFEIDLIEWKAGQADLLLQTRGHDGYVRSVISPSGTVKYSTWMSNFEGSGNINRTNVVVASMRDTNGDYDGTNSTNELPGTLLDDGQILTYIQSYDNADDSLSYYYSLTDKTTGVVTGPTFITTLTAAEHSPDGNSDGVGDGFYSVSTGNKWGQPNNQDAVLIQYKKWGTGTNEAGDLYPAKLGINSITVATSDDDRDGVINRNDAFPSNPYETADSDSDNVGNNSDQYEGYNDGAITTLASAISTAQALQGTGDAAGTNTFDYYVGELGYSSGGGAITQEAYDAAVAAQATAVAAQATAETALANAREARPGSTVIDVANDLADITLRVEQTSDVSDWSSATTSDHTIQLSAPAGASFYRFTIPE